MGQAARDGRLEGAAAGKASTAAAWNGFSAAWGSGFLLNNVHENEPVTFQTRWTLSYLRGP